MARRNDQIAGLMLLSFALFYMYESLKLSGHGIGSRFAEDAPGPNLMPLALAAFLIAAGLAITVVGTLRPAETRAAGEGLPGREGWRRLAVVLVALIIYSQITPVLGFAVSTFVFMTAMLIVPDRHSRPVTLGLPLVVSLVIYFVFIRVLHVPLPTNTLGF